MAVVAEVGGLAMRRYGWANGDVEAGRVGTVGQMRDEEVGIRVSRVECGQVLLRDAT